MSDLAKILMGGGYVDPFEVELENNQHNLANALKHGTIRKPRVYNPGSNTFDLRELQDNPRAQIMADAALGLSGGIVWHGSPHKFSKFDMSKIGTGEGAQAYGHGLYFADNPNVAKSYLRLEDKTLSVDGIPLRESNLSRDAVNLGQFMAVTGKSVGTVKNSILDRLETAKRWVRDHPNLPNAKEKLKKAIYDLDRINEFDGKAVELINPEGNLYKADLPDEAISKMLDWDKPLSGQAESVRKWIRQNPEAKKIIEKHNPEYLRRAEGINADQRYSGGMFGGQFHSHLADAMRKSGAIGEEIADPYPLIKTSPQAASDYLAKSGIPGIKYLDQMSRGAGKGSRNYVVFDDSLVKILERNGIPIE